MVPEGLDAEIAWKGSKVEKRLLAAGIAEGKNAEHFVWEVVDGVARVHAESVDRWRVQGVSLGCSTASVVGACQRPTSSATPRPSPTLPAPPRAEVLTEMRRSANPGGDSDLCNQLHEGDISARTMMSWSCHTQAETRTSRPVRQVPVGGGSKLLLPNEPRPRASARRTTRTALSLYRTS